MSADAADTVRRRAAHALEFTELMFATASIMVIAGYDMAFSSLGALAGVGLALYFGRGARDRA